MTDVLIKGRSLGIDSRIVPCEEGRDLGDSSISQGMPKITIKSPRTKEEA